MIAKLSTGTAATHCGGFRGALKYDLRVGRGEEFNGTYSVLAMEGVTFDYDHDGKFKFDLKQIDKDFRQQAMAYQGRMEIRKPVYHWALSYHPDDGVSDAQMLADAKDFLSRVGFVDTQYMITAHHDKEHPHVHIVSNVVNNHGQRISTMGLIDRAHAAAKAITTEKGYTWGKPQTKDIMEHPNIKRRDKVRMHMSHLVRQTLAESNDFDEFCTKLKALTIDCRYQMATDGKRGRLSFAVQYHGFLHKFNGSDLGKDLSFYHVNRKLKLSFNPRDVLLSCFRFEDVVDAMSSRQTACKPLYNNENGRLVDLVLHELNKKEIKASDLLSPKEMQDLTAHWNKEIEPVACTYHDEALENIKIILAELGKPGPSPFKNTHGNPVGRNSSYERYEREKKEQEALTAKEQAEMNARRLR